MPQNMKSVVIFDPKNTDVERFNKFNNWLRHNKSAVADKAVPNKHETTKMLYEK